MLNSTATPAATCPVMLAAAMTPFKPAMKCSTIFYGDAGGNMGDHAIGGDDTFIGNASSANGRSQAYGDALTMSGNARGGDDTLHRR